MIKFHYIILLIILFQPNLSFAQNFDLDSKDFKVGDIYRPKIEFEYNKADLKYGSMIHLDSVAKFLVQNDNLLIEIGVHTDFRGSTEYSRRVTQRRAQSIMEYIITKGLNPERFIVKGYEDDVPIKIDSAYFQKTFVGTKITKPTAKDYSGIDGKTKEKVFSSFAEQKSTFVPGVVLNEIFIRSLKSNGLRECAHQMNRRTELKIIGIGYKNE